MQNNDHARFRLLHPRAIRDLLRGFAPKDLVGVIDFDTPERAPTEYMGADLRQRRSDMVWRVRVRSRGSGPQRLVPGFLLRHTAGKPGPDAGFAPEKAECRGVLKSRFRLLHIGCPVPGRDRTDQGSAIAAIRQTCCSTGGYVRCARSIFPPFTAAPSASTG